MTQDHDRSTGYQHAQDEPGTASLSSGESENSLEVDAPLAEQKREQKAKTSGVAWFAALLAMLALGSAGYLYYMLVYLAPVAGLERQIDEIADRSGAVVDRLEKSLVEQQTAFAESLAQAQQQQATELAETQAAVLESLQNVMLAAPPSQREWKLAQAEYLLRIGNHRVLMEQDSQGALTLFLAVDQLLAELDDFSLYEVRAILANEIIALRQVRRQDLQGIYLRLEALKSQTENLLFKAPEYVVAKVKSDPAETVWSELSAQIKEFIRVRKVTGDETVQALLAPEEEQYLELNLRLALEQAQLAVLKRQQVVYQHALGNVRAWLEQYVDDRSDTLTAEIDALLEIELAQPLPNVSGSLSGLNQIMRGGE